MTATTITYQQRGYCSKAGYAKLREVLDDCRRLYNAALQERRDAYRMAGKSVSWVDQNRSLTDIRADWPEREGAVDRRVQRGVLRRLERAYQAFFRRVKAGETPGFPRFKSAARYRTIDVEAPTGAMLKVSDDGRKAWVRVKGLPTIEMRLKRWLPSPGAIKSLRLVWRPTGVWVDMVFAVEKQPLPKSTLPIGIDSGVTDRLALSDGRLVEGRKVDRSRENRLRQAVERSTKRDSLGRVSGPQSKRRAKRVAMLSRECERNARRNRNECHRLTTEIVKTYGRIAVEKLNIRGMTARPGRRLPREASASENPVRGDTHHSPVGGVPAHEGDASNRRRAREYSKGVPAHEGDAPIPGGFPMHGETSRSRDFTGRAGKRGLNREILAQTWGIIREQLRYKAEWAGREFVEVDPKYTSQMCSRCGVKGSRDAKLFTCANCGLHYDADLNAAANILRRAFGPTGGYVRRNRAGNTPGQVALLPG